MRTVISVVMALAMYCAMCGLAASADEVVKVTLDVKKVVVDAAGPIKFHGNVDIRLDTCSIHLKSSAGSYNHTQPRYRQNLAPLKGTHICFTFPLDNPS